MKWTQGAKGKRKVDEEDTRSKGKERENRQAPQGCCQHGGPAPLQGTGTSWAQQAHGAHMPSSAHRDGYSPGALEKLLFAPHCYKNACATSSLCELGLLPPLPRHSSDPGAARLELGQGALRSPGRDTGTSAHTGLIFPS